MFSHDSQDSGFRYPGGITKHSTVLVVECRPQSDNNVQEALLRARAENAAFRDCYDFNYFHWTPNDWDVAKSLHEFENWLRLVPCWDFPGDRDSIQVVRASEKRTNELSDSLSRLKAVIIGWDSGDSGSEILRRTRFFYPNMPVFVISYRGHHYQGDCELQTELCDLVTNEALGGAPLVYRADDMLGLDANNLLTKITKMIARAEEAPYWNALKAYSESPVHSFHALPVGHRRSTSRSIVDFTEFFGPRALSAETSLAAGPLDSLLEPKGILRSAQNRAAVAFGVRPGLSPDSDPPKDLQGTGTRFVTNGTSASNRIVLASILKQDDYVLIDRNCHISHHYALSYAYAKPIYLEPFHNQFGIAGPIPLETIGAEVAKLVVDHGRVPAAIVLTNPTFDGFFYRPEKVIRTVAQSLEAAWSTLIRQLGSEGIRGNTEAASTCRQLLKQISQCLTSAGEVDGHEDKLLTLAANDACTPDATDEPQQCAGCFSAAAMKCLVFLFDEAWAACAYFHPRLIEFTGMKAALLLRQGGRKASNPARHGHSIHEVTANARIYVTQSTHKSLSSLRQGSMIHYSDPLAARTDGRIRRNFDQAYKSCTTTSASASILASLDIARRQAQADGSELVERSIRLASEFRKALGEKERDGFFAVSTEAMMVSSDGASLSQDAYYVDPTRVTITTNSGISGSVIRRLLLEKDIQVNKYDNRSVLAIFNIGITGSSSSALIRAIRGIENQTLVSTTKPVQTMPLPKFNSNLGGRNIGYWLINQGAHKETFLAITDVEAIHEANARGLLYVSSAFVTPYPPGYPALVPGQEVTVHDLEYLANLKNEEIHGAKLEDAVVKIPVLEVERSTR